MNNTVVDAIGISLEMQKKTLQLIKVLMEHEIAISGLVILIEKVGYGFFWGKPNLDDLRESAEYFREKDLDLKFSVTEAVYEVPAGKLMEKIHRLTADANLPGILVFLARRQLLKTLRFLAERRQRLQQAA